MKTLLLTLILALAATTALAGNGIYHGYRARAFHYNPYGNGSPQVLGYSRNHTYQRYTPSYRRYRGSPRYVRGESYGDVRRIYTGNAITPGEMLRSRMQAQDIATELYLWSPIAR